MKKSAPSGFTRIEEYRLRLQQKRQDMLSGLGVKFDTLARLGRVAEDDQAQLSHEEFVSLHLNRLDYGQLRLVNEALDRLASGDYGVCLGCEEPIPDKRLAALPWARYCISCQERENQENWEWSEAGLAVK
jgi:DnaK suppressor protein